MIIHRTLRQILSRSQQNIILPPTYLLPFRARLSITPCTAHRRLSSTAFHSPPPPPPPPPPSYTSETSTQSPIPISAEQLLKKSQSGLSDSPHTSSSLALLPVLAAQPPHYIIVRIHQRPYLLTYGDSLRLPFNLHGAPPGTILRLTRASALGSRDYTFRGKPFIDERYFVCRVRVVGVEGEPMRVKEKTKQRQRHVKRVKSKMRYTVVRCIELKILAEEEAEAEKMDNLNESTILTEEEAEVEKKDKPNESTISTEEEAEAEKRDKPNESTISTAELASEH